MAPSPRHALLNVVDKHKKEMPDAAYKEIVEHLAKLRQPLQYEITYIEQIITAKNDALFPALDFEKTRLRQKTCSLHTFVDFVLSTEFDLGSNTRNEVLLERLEEMVDQPICEIDRLCNRPTASFSKMISKLEEDEIQLQNISIVTIKRA